MKTEDITKFFLRKPVLFWSLMVGIVVMGVISFIQMPKLEDPAINAKQAQVIVPYLGATAHEVELKVAQVMEDKLRTLPDVDKISSDCQNGMASITVKFKMTVLNKDLEQHFDILRRKVEEAQSSLPADCMAPIVVDDMTDTYGLFFALYGDGYSYADLEKYAKYIKRNLVTVDGVKRINIVGNRSEVIDITLSKEQIARNGLIPTEIMLYLQSAGKTASAGKWENGDDRISILVNNGLENEDDIANLLIKSTDGGSVRLGDIAKVERTYAEPQTHGFFVGKEPALAICIAMENDVVVPEVGKAVDKKLAEVMKDVPVGMEMKKMFFQPDQVNEAISAFMLNLLESVLIVILVLIVAMGFRSGLIIGTGLVLTITLSFSVLNIMGSTLQRISLGAFIIAMGMLVDNAIVIMDGILADKKKGLPEKEYLFRIGNHTAMPLLGATLVAVSAFIGVYLSPDTAGEYCRDLFLVLFVSLVCSWILAIVQVPIFAKTLIKEDEVMKNDKGTDGKLQRFVRKVITFLLERKALTITAAVFILVLCGLGMTKVKNVFFPDFDYKQFVIEYQLPSDSGPDKVKHDLMEITDYLQKNSKVESVASSMGNAPAHYCLVRPMTAGGDSYGELMVNCKDFKTCNKVVSEIRDSLRGMYPDAYIRFRRYNFSIGTSHPIEVAFSGPDPAVLKDLSRQAQEIMRQSPYIDHYSVEDNWHPMGKVLVADYNQQDAMRSGIMRGDVSNALRAATDGMPCGVINDNDEQVVVYMKVRNEDGSKIQDLKDIPVWGTLNVSLDPEAASGIMTGATKTSDLKNDLFKSTTLSNIADDLDVEWNEDFIHRVNGERTIEAECDPDLSNPKGTVAMAKASIEKQIEAISLPDGYTLKWLGEGETSQKASKNIIKYLPMTMFLMIFILLLLFDSWRRLLLIVLCIPFVICGIAPALLVSGQPFTFMAIIGLLGLMGMMVKNGIVLVDEVYRLSNEEKQDPYNAIINATVSRVRPVILASLTTILGMLPLLGDPMYGSMAICIMSGLAVGTVITLILLPVLYGTIYHVHKPSDNQ